jgi:hypothetical protein
MGRYGSGLEFDALVNTMQGIGNDIYRNSADLVNTRANAETRAIENKTKQLDLDEKQKVVDRLNAPVSLTGLFQAFGGTRQTTSQGQANTASRIIEVANSFGMDLENPDDPNPNQGLIFKSDGRKVTNRDIRDMSPQIGSYVLATYDPFPNALNTLAGVKRTMGFKSEGPTLSDDEIATASKSKDPTTRKAFQAYQKLYKDYDRYSKNPELLYSQQLGLIQQVEGFLKTVPGADTSMLTAKRSEIEGYIKKSTDQRVEQQDDIPVTGGLANAAGLKPGTLLPAQQAGPLGGQYMGLKGDMIKSNASVRTAEINQETENMASQRNNFNGIYYNEIPQRVDATIKGITDPAGRIVIQDPTDPNKKKVLSPQEAVALRENLVNKERATLLQDQFDRGMWPKLFPGTQPPDFIDKSPVDVRNEVKQQAGQVLDLLNQLDKTIPLNKNYAAQVETQLRNVAAGVRSGDTAKMNQARKDLLAVTAQVQEYLKQNRPGLPAQIRKNATRGLKPGGGGGY